MQAGGRRRLARLFGGKVVPPKQQKEWMEPVSTKTGEPIEGRRRAPATLIAGCVWIPDQDLMITVQTNGTDNLGDAVNAIYDIVKRPKAV